MDFLDSLVANTLVCSSCIVMLCYVVFLNRKHLFSSYVAPSVGTGFSVLWIVMSIYSALYCPPGGDNWRSGVAFYYPYIITGEEIHFESIYFRTMDIVPYSYVLWRIFVWGVLGASSYIILSKKLNIDKHLSTIACLTFALPILFYYQRAVAGYCLLYIAMALFITYKEHNVRNIGKYVTPIVILVIASLFHNAMPFYIVVLLVSLFLPLNKVTFFTTIGVLFIVSLSLNEFSIFFLEKATADTYEVGMNYLAEEYENNRNIWGRFFVIITKLPVWCMLCYAFYMHIFKGLYLNKKEQVLLLNSGLLILISLMFADTAGVIEGKFYTAAMLPFTLFVALFYQRYRGCKFCKFFVYLTIGCLILVNGYAILTNTFYYDV